jgi:predicted metal-binding membrane protein
MCPWGRDKMANTANPARVRIELWLPALLLGVAAIGWWWSALTARDMGGSAAADGMSMGAGSMSFLAFLAAWVAMMAAMMLPAVLPVVRLYGRAAARGTVAPILVFVAGYLLVWSAVGVPAFLAWHALRALLAQSLPWAGRVAGVVAVVAALYQVTPLKTLCLRHCRSPLSFFLHHSKNLNRPSGAVLAGGRHGLYCLGCCWMLMAILIAFGTMQLGVMVALAVLILLEKDAPFGEQLARAAAVVFLVAGAALLLHPLLISHVI